MNFLDVDDQNLTIVQNWLLLCESLELRYFEVCNTKHLEYRSFQIWDFGNFRIVGSVCPTHIVFLNSYFWKWWNFETLKLLKLWNSETSFLKFWNFNTSKFRNQVFQITRALSKRKMGVKQSAGEPTTSRWWGCKPPALVGERGFSMHVVAYLGRYGRFSSCDAQ